MFDSSSYYMQDMAVPYVKLHGGNLLNSCVEISAHIPGGYTSYTKHNATWKVTSVSLKCHANTSLNLSPQLNKFLEIRCYVYMFYMKKK